MAPRRSVDCLVEMAPSECLDRLHAAHVGRVGITVEALPVILPVNFAVHENGILFRTMAGTKLDAATNGTVVAFQADAYVPDGSGGWSVLVVGPCRRVEDGSVLRATKELLPRAWGPAARADHVVRVEIVQMTGRSFGDLSNPWLLLH